MENICFDCLQKQKPWLTKDDALLYAQKSRCDECGEDKQLVFKFVNDRKNNYDNLFLDSCFRGN